MANDMNRAPSEARAPATAPPRLSPILWRGVAFAGLWCVLAEGKGDNWLLAAAAVALATWSSLAMLPPGAGVVSPVGLVRFLAFFVWNSIRGGLQVAWMALRGRASLRPGLLEIPLTVPAGGARVLLVNTLGLMPGTLGVEMTDETLLVHVLDERLPVMAETRALEALIGRLFGSAT
jgi:multicomponent Na+:H+ antiporter subunit E